MHAPRARARHTLVVAILLALLASLVVGVAPAAAVDDDGIPDDIDNCPDVANPDQGDEDEDGIGDACDELAADVDDDGVWDLWDNCPEDANPDQEDFDGDGVGDACQAPIDCGPDSAVGPVNLGFESGLTGWTVILRESAEGVVALNAADSFASPLAGASMARLGSTAPDDTVDQPIGQNVLCQDFIVQADQTTIDLALNLFTFDYTGFDRFVLDVTVLPEPGADNGVLIDRREQTAWGAAGDTSLKTSDWIPISIDLSDHVGRTVRLLLSAGGDQDELFHSWGYVDEGSGEAEEIIAPTITVGSSASVTTDISGKSTVAMTSSEVSPVTIVQAVSCPDGQSMDGAPTLVFGGEEYVMADVGGGQWSAVIPAEDIAADGDVAVSVVCTDGSTSLTHATTVATIELYDPSGIITNAATGAAIVGATVTLHKVPGWTPKSAPGDSTPNTCESNLSKAPGADWSQAAPTAEGVQVAAVSPQISPNVNPFVTNGVGYYGWDVAMGCWYVIVAAAGFQTLVSPVVGVPPEVTDLDLALTPIAPAGGGGGSAGQTTPTGTARVSATGASTAASIATGAGTTTVDLDDLDEDVTVTVREIAAPEDDDTLLLDTAFEISVSSERFGRATVCVPFRSGEVTALDLEERELRLYHGEGLDDITTEVDVAGDRVCGQTTSFSPFSIGVPRTTRLAGTDRIATAIAISEATVPDGSASGIVLARSDDHADALAGTPLAASHEGSVLLTPSGSVPGPVLEEIRRALAPDGVVLVLGGSGAISDSVIEALVERGIAVERVAGLDRFATAVAIAEELGGPSTVLLADGTSFADALTAGAAASSVGAAVLLTDGATLPAATAAWLDRHDARRYAVGGPAAAADPLADRLVGADRFETSAIVADALYGTPSAVGVASGWTAADAIAGGAHAASLGAPLLLVDRDALPPTVGSMIAALGANRAYVYGGTAGVSPAAVGDVAGALR